MTKYLKKASKTPETETAAVLQSREGLKNDMAASIETAVEAINRGSE